MPGMLPSRATARRQVSIAGVPSGSGRLAPMATSAISVPMTARRELCSGQTAAPLRARGGG